MNKLWLVARHEYRRHVLRKGFILLLLSVPAAIALSIGLGAYAESRENRSAAVGYVDLAGVLSDPLAAPPRGSSPNSIGVPAVVPLVPYGSEEAARAALDAGRIQAYYVVTAGYLQTNRVDLVYIAAPGDSVRRQFWDFMQINRLRDLPPAVAERAVAGPNLAVRWPADMPGGGREFSGESFFDTLLPLFGALTFLILLASSGGYLMQAVVEEKESRTMEVVVTSLSPGQFIAGKVAGIAGVALTQLVGWAACCVLAVWVGGHLLDIGLLQGLRIDWRIMGTMVALGLPTYVMFAAVLTAVGATVAQAQEAQQVSGLLGLFSAVPFWFAMPILENPNGALAIGMSLFPATALPALSFRLAFSPVPPWQIGLSVALLTASALGAVWLAGRAFRLGMVRYGQRLRWGEILRPRTGGSDG
jgi:ABC-2 type transport system permease protein